MAFRPGRRPIQFADLKSILAQSKDLEEPLYQVVQEIIERLSTLSFVETPTTPTGGNGGGGGGGASVDATYLTKSDETATLPSSVQFLARYGLKFDDSLVTKRLIDLDLEYLGTYASGPLYSDGDVVIGPDNIAYMCVRPTNNAPTPWPGTGIPSPPPVNDATYWTVSPHAGLSNERALNSLANGYVKSTAGEPSTISIIPLSEGGTGASLALGGTGTVLSSNGSSVIFDTGIRIPQLNADALIAGQVNPARLNTFLNTNNAWGAQQDFQGYVTFSHAPGSQSPTIVNVSPRINFYETDRGADDHYKIINLDGGAFQFQAINDAYSAVLNTMMSITNAGVVIGAAGTSPIYADGAQLTNLNATQLTSGTVPLPRLGTNSPAVGTFLGWDNQWRTPPGGFPSGLIVLSDVPCPVGWTRVNWDGSFLRVNSSAGSTGGAASHQHGAGTLSGNAHSHGGQTGSVNVSFSGNTGSAGAHSHSFSFHVGGTTGGGSGSVQTADAGGSFQVLTPPHTHSFGADVGGNTDGVGDHQHSFSGSGSGVGSIASEGIGISGSTAAQSSLPPYIDVILCRKD